MSRASEMQKVAETLPAYSLMGVRQVAKYLGRSYKVVKAMIDDGTIPSVPVGSSRMVDPYTLITWKLAEEEGVSLEEYRRRHGSAVADRAAAYYRDIRKLMAEAA